MTKKYFTCIPAVYLVLEQNDKILLLERSNTGYQDGMYSLPAGHIDGDESLVSALAREAKEEINITIDVADITLSHVQHRRASNEDLSNERLDFYFTCSKWTGDIRNNEPHKCASLLWADQDKLPDNIIDHVKIALHGRSHHTTYSSFGWD